MKMKSKVGVGGKGIKNAGKATVAPKAKKGIVVSKNQTGNAANRGMAKYGMTMKKGGSMKSK